MCIRCWSYTEFTYNTNVLEFITLHEIYALRKFVSTYEDICQSVSHSTYQHFSKRLRVTYV